MLQLPPGRVPTRFWAQFAEIFAEVTADLVKSILHSSGVSLPVVTLPLLKMRVQKSVGYGQTFHCLYSYFLHL